MNSEVDTHLPVQVQEREFRAVCALLDDTDEAVAVAVEQKLRSYGVAVLASLREFAAQSGNPLVSDSVTRLARHYQHTALQELTQLIRTAIRVRHDLDLEDALVTLSRFGYPETSAANLKEHINSMALQVHRMFMEGRVKSELQLVLSLNHILFEEEHFRGACSSDYHNPDNSYVHTLLRRRTGIPISLSVLYLLLADRVGVEIHPINTPGHFVVYSPELNIYIDAFSKGIFRSRRELREFLRTINERDDDSVIRRAANVTILIRMLRNLLYAHRRQNDEWEAAALEGALREIEEVMDED